MKAGYISPSKAKLSYRVAQRDCKCSCCNRRVFQFTTKIMYFKCFKGHKQPVIICKQCMDRMIQIFEGTACAEDFDNTGL